MWSTDLGDQRCVLEEHCDEITDACFSPQRPWLATSSIDKTVKVWDVEKVSQHLICMAQIDISSLSISSCYLILICNCCGYIANGGIL